MNKQIIFSSCYFFIFFSVGIFTPMMSPLFIENGFSGLAIGKTFAIGALISIVMRPVWGMLADKFKDFKIIIGFLILAYTLTCFVFLGEYSTLTIMKGYLVFICFFCGINPLIDSMVLGNRLEFGKIRLWGSVGFAIGAQSSGLIASLLGISSIFILLMVSNIIALLILIFTTNPDNIKKNKKVFYLLELKQLLSNRDYMLFLGASTLITGTVGASNNYFGILYQMLGGKPSGIGFAFLLFAGSEAIVMLIAQKRKRKINVILALIVSTLFIISRYILYSAMPPKEIILLFFFLQGIGLGGYILFSVLFLNDIVTSSFRTTAIGIYISISSGIGGMISNYLSGVILNIWGISSVYSYYYVSSFFGLLILIIMHMKNKKKFNLQRG